jgi:excisionase family DNA binding protein
VTDRLLTALDRELARSLLAAMREDADLRAELRALLLDEEQDEAMASNSPWLALDEAATYLRVSERTLERRVKAGRLRSTTIGRRRLLHRDDLDALAENGGGGGESASQLHPATEE